MSAPKENKFAEKWTLEIVQEKLSVMLDELEANRTIVYIGTLCTHFELYRDIIDYWESKFSEDEQVFRTIKRIKAICEERLFTGALYGKLKETTAIFGLKNNHKWVDKSETNINLSGSIKTSKDLSDDELAAIAAGHK